MNPIENFFLTSLLDDVFGPGKGHQIMSYLPGVLAAIEANTPLTLAGGQQGNGVTPGSPILLWGLHQIFGEAKGDRVYSHLSLILEAIAAGGLSLVPAQVTVANPTP